MALRKKARTIPISDIRSGQVLEIKYDGDIDLILVIDPKAKDTSPTSQGRPNKLHAIKLANFVESDLINLISEIRSTGTSRGAVTNYDPYTLYKKFISSKYSVRRSYRTYTPSKITSAMRITVGQDAPGGTNKVQIGNSVLYGVEHNQYVQISIDDYDTLEMELNRVNNQTFYEGLTGHEDVTLEVIKAVIGTELVGESWDINMESGEDELRTILPLFGPAFEEGGKGIFPNVQRKLSGKILTGNETLMQVLLMADGSGGWINNASETNIKKIISMARPDTQTQLNNYLYGPYTKENFKKFHEIGQKYAFADYEDGLGEYYKGADITQLQIVANKMRDERLINFMKTRSGIYFAGSSHLDNIRKMM